MSNPQVTLVVVQRERFSYTRQSLESIYQSIQIPFKLVYVDGNSPPKIRDYLREQARNRGFQLIRTEEYLSPNRARNLGLKQVKTKYVVFMDNDVIVSPGWLERLIECAEETQGTVVGPLVCQDEPVHEIVHFAGGEYHIWTDKTGRQRLREKMYKQGQQVNDIYHKLQRQPTELAEFHCVLVRRAIFDQIGFLDEAFLNTKEHLDFCMSVTKAGGAIYFEPASIVTYVPGPPLVWSDVPFYMLRWSDAWTVASLQRMREKWQVAEDQYFQSKYEKLGWRRRETLIIPLSRRLSFGWKNRYLEAILARLDRWFLNRYITARYAQRQSGTVKGNGN